MEVAESLFTPMTESERRYSVEATKLSDDPAAWQQEISEQLKGGITMPPHAITVIHVKPVGEERESATGAIEVRLQGTKVIIPVVIRGKMLSPLDTFFIDGDEEAIRPLTQENFDQVISRQAPDQMLGRRTGRADGIVSNFLSGEQSGFSEALYPPHSGGQFGKHASEFPEGLVADLSNENLLAPSDVIKTAHLLAENPHVAEALKDQSVCPEEPHSMDVESTPKLAHGILSGIGSLGKEVHDVDPSRLLPEDVYQIRRVGPLAFRLYATLSRCFIPKVVEMSSEQVRDFLEHVLTSANKRGNIDVGARVESLLSQLMRCGHVTLSTRSRARKPDAVTPSKIQAQPADMPGFYAVRTADGTPHTGPCFTNVVDFDGRPLPTSLFICAESGNYSLQEAIAGKKLSKPLTPETVGEMATSYDGVPFSGVDEIDIGIGQGFVLVWWPEGMSEARVTLPMQLEGIGNMGGEYSLAAKAGLGRKLKLIVDGSVQGPVAEGSEAATGRECYRVPASARVVRVGGPVCLTETPAMFSKVASAETPEQSLSRFEMHSSGGLGSKPDGKMFHVKVAGRKLPDLSYQDVDLLLATCGADAYSRKRWVEKAAAGKKVVEHDAIEEPFMSFEEIDHFAKLAWREVNDPETVDEVEDFVSAVREICPIGEQLKLAAALPDGVVADRTMALSYLTPQNTQAFKRYVKEFRRTASKLARLLLFSRTTGKMDEVALKRSMILLDRVANGLENLGQLKLPESYS